MASIPISELVNVNPGVLAAAGSAVDLNGVILTENTTLPAQTATLFATQQEVSDYFGPTSDEANAASVYFAGYDNSTVKPGQLYFFRYSTDPTAAFLKSGSMEGVTITELQGFSGDLTISIDGTPQTVTPDLSTVTSFSEAADIIETAMTGATVTYDGLMSAFFIESATTGSSSGVSFGSDPLATDLKLTQSTGALQSAGSDGDTPVTAMEALTDDTQNWGVFTTLFEPDLEDKKAFADWTNDQGERYCYAPWDSDVTAKQNDPVDTLGTYLQTNHLTGTAPVWSTSYEQAVFVLAFAASLDFNRLNGRATMAWKSQSGLTPTVTNASDATTLDANGYNFYGIYANRKDTLNLFQPGSVSGDWAWLDTYLNQIWLNANLQLALVTLLSSVGYVPYNADGSALIYNACLDPIERAVNFGAITTGVQLSNSQYQQVKNALGVDVRQSLRQKGFYLQVNAASTPSSVRVERGSPSLTLYYVDGGSIQSITLASIAIQ